MQKKKEKETSLRSSNNNTNNQTLTTIHQCFEENPNPIYTIPRLQNQYPTTEQRAETSKP